MKGLRKINLKLTGTIALVVFLFVAIPLTVLSVFNASKQPFHASAQTIMTLSGTCILSQIAFCDQFNQPAADFNAPNLPREGQMDPVKWSFSRFTQNINPTQGAVWPWIPTTIQFCRTTINNIIPNQDSFICDGNGMETMHWMEAFNDDGSYAYDNARIRQPFDFASRTGKIVFDVDAVMLDAHAFWPEVWIADQPIPGPHSTNPGISSSARNAIGFRFNSDCGQSGKLGTVGEIVIVRNYVESQATINQSASPCYTTMNDMFNRFEIDVNQNHVDIYASANTPDHGMTYPNYRLIASADNINLGFTQGYVSFQQTHYNSAKFGFPAFNTYHWDNLGFDGPVLPTPRNYEINNALTPLDGLSNANGVNLGWLLKDGGISTCCPNNQLTTTPFTFSNVNLANATGAELTLGTWSFVSGESFKYRFNSGAWRTFIYPFPDARDGALGLSIPVSLADLVQGTNTLDLQASNNGSLGFGNPVANIDLTIEVSSSSVDAIPPTVTITNPTAGTTIGGSAVNITAAANDNVGVSKVEIYVDGVLSFTSNLAPYNFSWIPTSGAHSIEAIAYDAAGNTGYSTFGVDASGTVTNNPPPPVNPPPPPPNGAVVSITQPASGATVSGSVTILAQAVNSSGVSSVAFIIDTKQIGTDSTSPFNFTWDSTTVANGSHTIVVRPLNVTGPDASITVTVANSSPTNPPPPPPPPPPPVNPSPGNPPPTAPVTKVGDLNGDLLVNIRDLSILASNWGHSGAGILGDLNGDGVVNIRDLSILAAHWGS